MEETPTPLSKKEAYELKHQEKLKQRQAHSRKFSFPSWAKYAAILAVGLGIFWKLITPGGISTADSNYDPLVVHPGDYIKGEATASATLVEFADFQCPACATYASMIDQILAENPGKMKVVFRHFPLTEIHPQAMYVSQAAEAAGKQGRFWQMYSLLYANQKEWEKQKDLNAVFSSYADNMGLDVNQFKKDLNSQEVKRIVERDRSAAQQLSLNSTPTFFLNGKKISNPRSVEDFKKLLESTN